MAPKKNPKAAAEERQAALEAERELKAAADRERLESEAWAVGADSRSANRQKELEEKAMAKAKAKADKDMLLAEEEASVSSAGKKPKANKKVKDDFQALNAALATMPKTKAQKQAEEKKKQDEERQRKESEEAEKREARRAQEEVERKKAAARGISLDHTDDLMRENVNHQQSEFEEVTGLDAALGVLSVKGDEPMQHPEKKMKALYNAYYERMLPLLKEEHPGLKLSQYKERIFDQWQKAPENPMNQKTA